MEIRTATQVAKDTGIERKRIYTLLRLGKIKSVLVASPIPGGRQQHNITSTEEEIKQAHAEVPTRKYTPRGTSEEGKGAGTKDSYISIKQLSRELGISGGAARQRIYTHDLKSKCIMVGSELAIPRRYVNRLRDVRGKSPTATPRETKVTSIGNGLNTRMERIEKSVQDLSTKLDTLLKLWS